MSASAYRYQPAPDRNQALRAQIVALAQRNRRYGSGMIYLKLRQSGMTVNHKRVERLYAEEKLQVRRRKRKKVPVSDRQPLGRPATANQVWSMDFVFDRTVEGRVIKNLTVVDGATHEAVAIVPERTFNGRFRDECLNEHWFTSLHHAEVVIEAWRREYNEERPKKSLGGLTPATYARKLAEKQLH
ncbi:IS3 family transposase [Pandoraea captiosa]|uniref:IS3 family transposase n=1 Tax=Pandoraea captiosa TaxID=2508302 RepID=A0A5E4ZPC2_9BURK|nr:IS3 family transposase [Pandoraea captiosa]